MKNAKQLPAFIAKHRHFLVLQPDGADGDSLGTALALEEILGDMGKQVSLFTYREVDSYLHIMEGWDRVSQDFPAQFDATILVDTGSPVSQMSATLQHHGEALAKKPMVIIDHHDSRTKFTPALFEIVDSKAVATAEMIVSLAKTNKWPVNERAANKLAAALLSDSLNLTTPGTTANSVKALAYLVENGANLTELYRLKREASALEADLLTLKGKLLTSVQYEADGRLALVVIDSDTMKRYDKRHSPGDLVIWDMMWVKGVEVAAALNDYGGKIKVSMRAQRPIAARIAEQFGGGGHPGAAGCRIDGKTITEAKKAMIEAYNKVQHDETL